MRKKHWKKNKIYDDSLNKRKDFMGITQFKVEVIFGDILGKDNNNSRDQIIKPNKFLAKMMEL